MYNGAALATEAQSRTQFSLWALAGAPLLISGTVARRKMSADNTFSRIGTRTAIQDTAPDSRMLISC